jgi:hypothetical protein
MEQAITIHIMGDGGSKGGGRWPRISMAATAMDFAVTAGKPEIKKKRVSCCSNRQGTNEF